MKVRSAKSSSLARVFEARVARESYSPLQAPRKSQPAAWSSPPPFRADELSRSATPRAPTEACPRARPRHARTATVQHVRWPPPENREHRYRQTCRPTGKTRFTRQHATRSGHPPSAAACVAPTNAPPRRAIACHATGLHDSPHSPMEWMKLPMSPAPKLSILAILDELSGPNRERTLPFVAVPPPARRRFSRMPPALCRPTRLQ